MSESKKNTSIIDRIESEIKNHFNFDEMPTEARRTVEKAVEEMKFVMITELQECNKWMNHEMGISESTQSISLENLTNRETKNIIFGIHNIYLSLIDDFMKNSIIALEKNNPEVFIQFSNHMAVVIQVFMNLFGDEYENNVGLRGIVIGGMA